MEIKIISRPLLNGHGETLVLGHYEGEAISGELARVNRPLNGQINEVLVSKEFSGKFLETLLLRTTRKNMPRILLLGLGKKGEITQDKIRQAAGKAATTIREAGQSTLAIALSQKQNGISIANFTQAIVEGIILSLYQFDLYKTDCPKPKKEITGITLVMTKASDKPQVARGALLGERIAEAANYARTLCNLPGDVVTPSRLEQEAKSLAESSDLVTVKVLERADVVALGMGAFAGVARGTHEPPKFIILEYKGAPGKPIALVGKSVTFDTGGISLKPADNMEQMKYDMSGGAAVLGAMRVAAQMKWPVHIVGILPATDNMPGGRAIHPGDIVKTLSGKTVEVINTDAEGRLCLADAITYSLRYKPRAIIDLATLTGACVVALGAHAMALYGNDYKLTTAIQKAADDACERVWPMPLWDDYYNQIKSDVADLKNTGGRPGGSITAALFLKQFAGDVPWVHLDIAGVAWNGDKPRPYTPKGSTGAGVRLLIQYLMTQAAQ
ncbi:MAG: leucyl aminopeptidase [Nitrospirota bacterium]